MPAPLAKGLIITASILIAAGIAIYESPQVRQWLDQSRRKIAVALHNLGDEIQPGSRSQDHEEREARRKRREELVRRSQAELIKKAQAEGIAVDLDELAHISEAAEAEEKKLLQEEEDRALAERLQKEFDRENETVVESAACVALESSSNPVAHINFDDLVGEGGLLRSEFAGSGMATGTEAISSTDEGLRRRGRVMEVVDRGTTFASPFADEEAQILFDRELIGVGEDELPPPLPPKIPTERGSTVNPSRDSSATLETSSPSKLTGQPVHPQLSRDTPSMQLHPYAEHEFWGSHSSADGHSNPFSDTHQAPDLDNFPDARSDSSFFSLQNSTADLYAVPSPPSSHQHPAQLHMQSLIIPPAPISSGNVAQPADAAAERDMEIMSAGTLTPTSDRGFEFASAVSDVGTAADDIAILSEPEHERADDNTDAMSDAYSVLSAGAATPSSWSDVGSVSDFDGLH